MSADSTKKTLIVAISLCLVCSVLVSSAAVALNSIQEKNKRLDKIKNILVAGGLYEENTDVQEVYKEKVKGVLIELETGKVVPEDQYNEKLNVENFNISDMSDDSEYGASVEEGDGLPGIKSRPKYMPVYEVVDNGEVEKYIFPVFGKGLWSTLYGFLALESNLETVSAITFYEHGETPGLGGEIDNPKWKALWQGKKVYDDDHRVKIAVIKGKVDPSNPNKDFLIDGLSGATLTTRGVDNLVRYWLGQNGYGVFIDNVREGNHNE